MGRSPTRGLPILLLRTFVAPGTFVASDSFVAGSTFVAAAAAEFPGSTICAVTARARVFTPLTTPLHRCTRPTTLYIAPHPGHLSSSILCPFYGLFCFGVWYHWLF